MTESKKLLFSKTRWRPALGTLHKLTVWYEHVDFRTHALSAKKVFNFISNEAAQSLTTFSDNSSHNALKATTNVEIWQISTHLAEKIISLSEIKTPTTTSCTCLFKMKETSKNIHANITLESTEDGGFIGEVILRGYRKEAPTEVVNLISAIMIDDAWANKHWRKALYALTACFGWLTRKNIQSLLREPQKEPIPIPSIKPTPARCNAETQTEHSEYSELGMQTDCSEFADMEAQTELIATKDVEVQVKFAPEKREFSIQTDAEEQPTAHHTHQRREDTRDSGPCAPEEIMPEISAESLHKMFIQRTDMKKDKNRILKDGSFEWIQKIHEWSEKTQKLRFIFLKHWTCFGERILLKKKTSEWVIAIGCFEFETLPKKGFEYLTDNLRQLIMGKCVISEKFIPLVLIKHQTDKRLTTWTLIFPARRGSAYGYSGFSADMISFSEPEGALMFILHETTILQNSVPYTFPESCDYRTELWIDHCEKRAKESARNKLLMSPWKASHGVCSEEAIFQTFLSFYEYCFSDQEHTHKPGASTK